MKYISTRGKIKSLGFSDTVLAGLADDGGLILPESIPDCRAELSAMMEMDYRQLCFHIMAKYVDFSDGELLDIVTRSYATFRAENVVELQRVGPFYLLELFHGPTLAFKDIALQFLGNLFEKVLSERGGELNVLAATSGDTGSAAIHGLRNRKNIRIFVMHPKGRVSRVQELQMTSVLDPNVFNMAVRGTFDDCQGIMKSIFSDLAFKEQYHLGTVNSINWARVMAQIVYYFYAGFAVMRQTGESSVSFSVPTGNFGDIFAGYIAWRMGLPVNRLILATNSNDILARFFTKSDYSLGTVSETLSPSMDIQVASNFERYLFYRCSGDSGRLASVMEKFKTSGVLDSSLLDSDCEGVFCAGSADDGHTLSVISEVWRKYKYIMDPHTAVGWKVASDLDIKGPVICLSTAHAAKFPEAVKKAAGRDMARHPVIEELAGRETRCESIDASLDMIKGFIASRLS